MGSGELRGTVRGDFSRRWKDADRMGLLVWQRTGTVFDGVGPSVTSDFYHKYKEYIALMKEVGLNSFRTSFQWSRIFSDCEGTVNETGVRFYQEVLDELLRQGIEPIICLHHFDMPMY